MVMNALKPIWSDGKASLNGWLSIASPFSAEIMAAQPYDSITIDMQHGIVDYADATGNACQQGRTLDTGAVAGCGPDHESARCRRLRCDLPDDQ